MRLRIFFVLVLVFVLPLLAVSAYADTAVLGDAASFAVLGHTTVTNVPTSVITGNVGVYPGLALPGFNFTSGASTADPQVTGTVESGTPLAQSAQASLTAAINALSGLSGSALNIGTGGLSGNVIVTPGVYSSPSTFTLTGTVTLDAQGLSNVDFIFLMGSALTANVGSNVNLINNTGTNVGVYWVAEGTGGSATLNGSTFAGNVLANISISVGSGVTITCGSVLASTGQVSLIMDTIKNGCNGGFISSTGQFVTTSGGTTGPGPGTPPVPAPEPGTLGLLSSGLALGLLTLRKLR